MNNVKLNRIANFYENYKVNPVTKRVDENWIIDYINSPQFRDEAQLLFGQMVKDSLLCLGDISFMKAICNTKQSVMARSLIGEINSIIGALSNQPRAPQIVVSEDNIGDATDIQEDLNRKLYDVLTFNPFDMLISAAKDRLIYGVGYLYLYKDRMTGKLLCKKLSPLQVYEQQCTKSTSSSSEDYVTIFEDLESDTSVCTNYGINIEDLKVAKKTVGDDEVFFTFIDNLYKQYILDSYDSFKMENRGSVKTESIMTFVPDSSKYERVRVSKYGTNVTRVIHAFVPSVKAEKSIDEDTGKVITPGYPVIQHYVIVGRQLIYQETLNLKPIISIGSRLVDVVPYTYRGISYNCQSLLVAYNSICTACVSSAINSPGNKLIIKEDLLKKDANRPLDVVSSPVLAVANMNMDEKLGNVVMGMSLPIVDQYSLAAIQVLNVQIREMLGLINFNQTGLSAEHEYIRMDIQMSSLKVYSNEIETSLKAMCRCILMNIIMNNEFHNTVDVDIKIVLAPDSQEYKKDQLNRVIQLSKALGGNLSLTLSSLCYLFNIDKTVKQMVEDGEAASQEGQKMVEIGNEAKVDQVKSDAIFKKASAFDKVASGLSRMKEHNISNKQVQKKTKR
ncbi:MAG: hypothetical protein ACRCX2_04855 [Paraclostridium sp.]